MSNRPPASPDRESRKRALKADVTLALRSAMGRVQPLKATYRRWYGRRRSDDLRAFHQVLSSSELDGRWWIWGGALLGLERGGDILPWDTDFDVAIRRQDLPALMRTVDILDRRGFKPEANFFDGEDLIAVHLVRHGFNYDFSVLDDVVPDEGGAGAARPGGTHPEELLYRALTTRAGEVVLLKGRVPTQELSTIHAWGCAWPCAADRDVDLGALYGASWRVPDPGWSALDSPSILRVTPYLGAVGGWTPLDATGAKLRR